MSGRVAWVTGASIGIGRAIALELSEGGWSLGLGARRADLLAETARALSGAEPRAWGRVDVADRGSVAEWARTLRGEIGEPDLVVNNAGYGTFAAVHLITDEDWDRTLATNLTGLFCVTRETLPAMLARGSGHFINVLSMAARVAYPKNAAYNASKFGALGFTEALRAEVRSRGVRVTAVLPGATDTPFWDRLGDWDRAKMMPPAAVARAVRQAADAGSGALVEEIRITPPLGSL